MSRGAQIKWWRISSLGPIAKRGNNTANKLPLFLNSLPTLLHQTNNQQRTGTKKIWKSYFCPKAVNAAGLPTPHHPPGALPSVVQLQAAAGTPGVPLTSGVLAAGNSGQVHPLPGKWLMAAAEGILKCLRAQKEDERAPCFCSLFLKAQRTLQVL